MDIPEGQDMIEGFRLGFIIVEIRQLFEVGFQVSRMLSMATELSAKMAFQNSRAERFRQASVISRGYDRSAPFPGDGRAA